MSKSSGTKTFFLAIIALALVGILGVMLYQVNQKTPEEKLSDSINDTIEAIGEITNGKPKN